MILEKIKSKLKKKKGAAAIEFTINMLIFLMVLSLGFEMVMITTKYMQVSDYANDLVRTIAIQGGVEKTAPSGFQGGSSAYKNFTTLINEKNELARIVGVSGNDLIVLITSGSTTVNLTSKIPIKIDYLETFKVSIDYRANSEVTHNFGAAINTILRRTKVGLSEYLHDYDK